MSDFRLRRTQEAIDDAARSVQILAQMVREAQAPELRRRNHGPSWGEWGIDRAITRTVDLCARASARVRRVVGEGPP